MSESVIELGLRVALVSAQLDRFIAAAQARGYRIVRNAFEVDEVDPSGFCWLGKKAGVCALAAYEVGADKGESLGLDHANISGEWDAFESGWDGTPWPDALRCFVPCDGEVLSRAFYDLGVTMAAKHHPEEP